MDEAKVARITAILFGLLALAMLGLTVLDHLYGAAPTPTFRKAFVAFALRLGRP